MGLCQVTLTLDTTTSQSERKSSKISPKQDSKLSSACDPKQLLSEPKWNRLTIARSVIEHTLGRIRDTPVRSEIKSSRMRFAACDPQLWPCEGVTRKKCHKKSTVDDNTCCIQFPERFASNVSITPGFPLGSVQVRSSPYEHIYIENIFEPQFYKCILSQLPPGTDAGGLSKLNRNRFTVWCRYRDSQIVW